MDNSLDWFVPYHMFLQDLVVVYSNKDRAFHPEFESIEEAKKYWEEWVEMSSENSKSLWKNAGHFGDCTNVSMTCNTCLIESMRQEAKYVYEFMKKLVNEGYPDEIFEQK